MTASAVYQSSKLKVLSDFSFSAIVHITALICMQEITVIVDRLISHLQKHHTAFY